MSKVGTNVSITQLYHAHAVHRLCWNAMRIVGGALSGRHIDAPPGSSTRPTSDRVREAIFNRLAHGVFGDVLVGGRVLDLFAGSGGLGLEALSRGATSCDLVDFSKDACATMGRNVQSLGLTSRALVHHSAADAFVRRASGLYQLVFVDPPYADAGHRLDRVLDLLVDKQILAPGALLIVEHGDHAIPRAISGEQAGLSLIDQRRYGQTVASFLSFTETTLRGMG